MRQLRWVIAVMALAVFCISTMWADTTVNFTDAFAPDTFVQFNSNGTNVNGAIISLNGAQLTWQGITVTGYWFNGSHWVTDGVNLVGRNVSAQISPDRGIGVCNPSEMTNAACPVDGNFNEISNQIKPEIIQVSRGTALENYKGVGISSLDNNSDAIGIGTPPVEHGRVFSSDLEASALTNGNLASIAGMNLLCGFSITGINQPSPGPCTLLNAPIGPEPDIGFVTPSTNNYLYLQALDFTDVAGNLNNDFLLRSILGDPTPPPIPEPSSLVLLATGLAGASIGLKRKFRG